MLGNVIVKVKQNDLFMKFNTYKQVVKILKKLDDHFLIKLKYRDIDLLRQNQIPYEIESYSGIIKYFLNLKQNIAIFIGIILFASLLYLNSISIKRIEFNAETNDNEQIEQIIRSHLDTYFMLSFLDADLNELNFQLRKDFSDYEWIDVTRHGTVLKVTVLKPTVINKKIVEQAGYGDLVAKKSGVITGYQIEHGVVVVQKKQYVKAGQVLVSGNLCVKREGWEPFYVRANGEVRALVHHEKTVTVNKKQVENELTGRVTTNKRLNLFGWEFEYTNNTVDYAEYDTNETEKKLKIFKFVLPISTKKIHYYEKNDIIKVYDDDNSYDYALSTALKEVKKGFNDGDTVEETIVLSKQEDGNQFTYRLLIVTNENIAQFQKRTIINESDQSDD